MSSGRSPTHHKPATGSECDHPVGVPQGRLKIPSKLLTGEGSRSAEKAAGRSGVSLDALDAALDRIDAETIE